MHQTAAGPQASLAAHSQVTPDQLCGRSRRARAVVVFLLGVLHGCRCDPPGDGTLVLTVRTWVPPAPRPTLGGGNGETLEGLTSLDATIERVDAVHRTAVDDPSTERVITIGVGPATVELTGGLDDASPRAVGEFAVPAGFVMQIRLVTSALTLRLRGEEHAVALTSADETGFKIDPMDEVPFEVREAEETGARVVLQPFEQLLRNRGVGFSTKPHLVAEHVENLDDLMPGTIVLDQVVVRFADGTPQFVIDGEIAAIGATVVSSWVPTNYYALKLPPDMNFRTALDHFDAVPSVAYTVPNFVLSYNQNDPEFEMGNQPQWPQVDLDDAYAAGFTGSYFPVIAVLDTGVRYTHPDLVENIWINVGEAPPALTAIDPGTGLMAADFDQDTFLTFADLNSVGLTMPQMAVLTAAGLTPRLVDTDPLITGAELLTVSTNGMDEDGNCPMGDDSSGDGIPCGLGDEFVDDVIGWDFRDRDNDPNAVFGDPTLCVPDHGTATSSIIGAMGNNGMNMTGAGWRVRILPIRLDDTALGDVTAPGPFETSVYEAIQYAASMGAHVMSGSFVLYFSTRSKRGCNSAGVFDLDPATYADYLSMRLEPELMDMYTNLNGALYVSSAGNCDFDHDDSELFVWPGGNGDNLNGPSGAVLRIASVRDSDRRSSFSDHGEMTVDLAAPGENYVVLNAAAGSGTTPLCFSGCSTSPNALCGGASHAGAFVAGIAAVVLAADPSLAFQGCALADRLIRNADTFSFLEGEAGVAGYRVNASRAAADVVTTPVRPCGP